MFVTCLHTCWLHSCLHYLILLQANHGLYHSSNNGLQQATINSPVVSSQSQLTVQNVRTTQKPTHRFPPPYPEAAAKSGQPGASGENNQLWQQGRITNNNIGSLNIQIPVTNHQDADVQNMVS